MTFHPDTPLHILLVEDDDVDAESLTRTFRKLQIDAVITNARDGIEALDLLNGNSAGLAPHRHLILLDINMPRMSGHEFLEQLRADPQLCGTPVFVFTTSEAPRDIQAAYARNVAGYFVKSQYADGLEPLARLLEMYWCQVTLPD